MKKASILLLAALCVLAWPCQGAPTVINRETFQGIRTLDAAAPGRFDGFASGSMQARAVGPRTSAIAAPGGSGDTQGAATDAYFDLTTGASKAAQANGMIGGWVRFVDFAAAGYFGGASSTNPAMVLELVRSDGDPFEQGIGVTASGHLVAVTPGGFVDGGAIAANTWYWLQVAWVTKGGVRTMVSSYQPRGGAAVVINSSTEGGTNGKVHVLDQPFTYPPAASQDFRWRGRIGNVTLGAIASLSDADIPADDIAPPAGPFHWYVNPATGSDANTGTSPAAAWASVAKFNAESVNAGLFGANVYQGGDTVSFDTSAAPLDPGALQLLPATPNLTLQPAAGQSTWTLKPWKDVSGASATWTQYDATNYPNIWMTTDGGAADLGDGTYGNACVWEDDAWLAHPNGTSIAAVAAALNATPGSFWVSPTTIYLVATGNGNPNANGKTYTRSRNRGGNGGDGLGSGASMVYISSAPTQIIGLNLRKTCLVRASDGDPYNGYGIQLDGAMPTGSTSRLANCSVDDMGKHGIGRTDGSSGHTVIFDACQVEQCTAYASNSPFVDYNGNAAATGNVSNWNGCTNLYPFGVVGYAVPNFAVTGYPQTPSYLSHNNGSGVQFSSINFLNPFFGGLVQGAPAAAITITGGTVLTASFNAPATIQQCTLTGFAPSLTTGSLLRNCRIVSTQAVLYNGSYAYLSGNVQIIGNTFDFSDPYLVVTVYDTYPLFIRDGALRLTCENNLVVTPAGEDFCFLAGASHTDTLTFARNAFDLAEGADVLDGYDDGTTVADRTLPQVRALGLDAGSFATTGPKLDADGFPAPDSPLVDAGLNLGPLVDLSGRFFDTRRTVGALEPMSTFARWQAQHFSAGEIAAGVGGPAADPDGDGRSNLLEYALGTDPNTADSSAATTSGVLSVGGQSYLALTFRQLEYTADLTYAPGVSGDLRQWQTGPDAVPLVSRVDNGDGTATTTVRDALPVGAGPERFLRLQVTAP